MKAMFPVIGNGVNYGRVLGHEFRDSFKVPGRAGMEVVSVFGLGGGRAGFVVVRGGVCSRDNYDEKDE